MKINKYLEENKPIIIKNYLKKNLEEKNKIIECINNSKDKNFFLRGSKYINNDNYKIIKDIKKNINQKKYKIDNKIRCWNHNNGNITKNHYDGNGVDVINICIKGKKKFIFTKPDSYINVPYTNLSIFKLDKEEEIIIILEENDLLLIPRFWYHTVETLEDNTYMLSIVVTDIEVELNDNKKLLYTMHKFFNTNMCKEYIVDNKTINNINLFNFVQEYLKESISLILLVIFLNNYLNDKNKLYSIIVNIILFLIKDNIGKDSCGMVQLIIINYSIINFLYLLLEKIYKSNKFNLISMENK
jgi:hypothetical protein